jgi:2,5-dihydroxypyridine 5,6-dioxygenase
VRSTGASAARRRRSPALGQTGFIVDCRPRLMRAGTPAILKSGARVLSLQRAPRALERTWATLGTRVRGGKNAARINRMATSTAHRLDVAMAGASTVGIWGWTEKPGAGTLAGARRELSQKRDNGPWCSMRRRHPDLQALSQRLPDPTTLDNDFVTRIDGDGADAE